MAKREKVILVIMSLAVVYGIYALFLSTPSKTTFDGAGEELKGLIRLITDVSVSLNKENLTEANTYTIARAEAEWVKDPFVEMEVTVISEKNGDLKAIDASLYKSMFNYSGFLEMGERRIAIVNGMEYQTGDEVEKGGYVVREINPTRVVIEIRGKQEKITVPLVEETLL